MPRLGEALQGHLATLIQIGMPLINDFRNGQEQKNRDEAGGTSLIFTLQKEKKNVNLDFVPMFIHNSKAAYTPFSFVGFVFPIQIM